MAAICIQNKMTIEQVSQLDICFNPWFNKPMTQLQAACVAALYDKEVGTEQFSK